MIKSISLQRDYLKGNIQGTFSSSEGDNLHGHSWCTPRSSKPEEGNATMALVTSKKMAVPSAECTSRTPTGYSCSTKRMMVEHCGRKQEKSFYATKKACMYKHISNSVTSQYHHSFLFKVTF